MTVTSPIDPKALEALLEITGGDQAFVDDLVDTYAAEGDRLVAELVAAADAGSIADLVRPAHSLKSSSVNVGAVGLGELCRRLEEEALSGAVADPAMRAEEIREAFAEAKAALLEERARR